ncbi:MAG: hypothetical protein ACR2RL_19865 [Gammaproteobacteria bacterium]
MSSKTSRPPTRLIATLLAIGLAIGVLLAAPPSARPDETDTPAASPLPPAPRTGIAESILEVQRRLAARAVAAATGARAQSMVSFSTARVRVNAAGSVHVYIYTSRLGEAALGRLRALAADIEAVDEKNAVVQAWVPFDRLDEIAELPLVTRIAPPSYRFTRAGSVTTEGDVILRADSVRGLGVDGSGVRVGIISNGFAGRATAQATGDLPAGVTGFGSCTPAPANLAACRGADACNEGTAIAEIIHDIAPGADLAIAAVGTTVEFVQRLDELVNDFGADIIIDDLGFFGQPFFEYGSVAQAVAAIPDSVLYVSSAGNDGDTHHAAQFRAALSNGLEVHDFGLAAGSGSDPSMPITVGSDGFVLAFLQWNDRFGSSGND